MRRVVAWRGNVSSTVIPVGVMAFCSLALGWSLANGNFTLLAAVAAIILCILALFDVLIAVAAWLLIAPFFQSGDPTDSTIQLADYVFHRGLLPLLALIVIGQQALQKKLHLAPPEKLFLLFLGYALISSLVTWGLNLSDEPAQVALRTLSFIYAVPLAAFLLAHRLPFTERRWRALLVALSLASMAISGAALLGYTLGIPFLPGASRWQEAWGIRAVGPLGNPAVSAYAAQVGLLAALYLAIRYRGLTYSCLSIAAALLTGFYTLLTYTRSAWLSFVMALATLLLFHRRARRWALVALTSVSVLLVANLGGLVNLDFLEQRAFDQDNVWGRLAISYTGLQMFFTQPLFGQGFGSYDQRVSDFAAPVFGLSADIGEFNTSHNTFLTILAELGLVGFALYAVAIGMALLPGLKALLSKEYEPSVDRLHLLVFLGGIVAYLVNALAIDMRFFSFAQSLFWFNLGLFYSLGTASRRSLTTVTKEGQSR